MRGRGYDLGRRPPWRLGGAESRGREELSSNVPELYLGVDADSGDRVSMPGDRPLLITGPTGCGKSSGAVIPAIRDWPGAVIAVSADEQLWEETAAERRERHGPTTVLDLCNRIGPRDQPATFELLAGCGNSEGGWQRRSAAIFGALQNPFGPRTAGTFVKGEHVFITPGMLLHAASVAGLPASAAGAWAMANDWAGAAAWAAHGGRADLAEMLRGAPEAIAPADLEWVRYLLAPLADPAVARWVSHPGFDLRDLLTVNGALFVTSSAQVQGLVNCFLQDVATELRSWTASGWQPAEPVLFVLDPIDELAWPFDQVEHPLDLITRSPGDGLLPLFTSSNTALWLAALRLPAAAGGEDTADADAYLARPQHLVFAAEYARHPEQAVVQRALARYVGQDLSGKAFVCEAAMRPDRAVHLPDARRAGSASSRLSADGRWRWDGEDWVPA